MGRAGIKSQVLQCLQTELGVLTVFQCCPNDDHCQADKEEAYVAGRAAFHYKIMGIVITSLLLLS